MNVVRIYVGTIAASAALILSLAAAPLRDVPQRLIQPDGTILECFASGDEYHNWLHDHNGYTIIRDPVTGYWVYAEERDGKLFPTPHVAGTIDPAAAGLVPEANITPENMLQKRTEYTGLMRLKEERTHPGFGPASAHHSPPPTVLNNLVVFIRFSDETEFGQSISYYDSLYNKQGEGVLSLYEYYQEASYGHLEIFSTFYPEPAGLTIVSFQDIQPRAYYKPYHETENPLGYDEDIQIFDYENPDGHTFREHSLLKRAVEYVESQIPPALVIDGIEAGRVDCVSFIVRGGPEGWSSLLWPHRWALWSQVATIHGKRVWDYTFQLEQGGGGGPMRLGTVAHEMFHILGAPDLYRYDNSGIPVGHWDLMAFTFNRPQHMGAYMKYFYGGWITEIPTITESGTYHLHPLTSPGQNSFRIPSATSADEYYIVEYRRRNTEFESILPGDGLIVYRINMLAAGTGNAEVPDEVYIYRPGGTVDSSGVIQQAFYSAGVGRTEISDFTSPSAFLSDNSPGGLYIHEIGSAGETISFTVEFDYHPPQVVHYDDGHEDTYVGTGAAVSGLQAAVRFTAEELSGYYGRELQSIRYVIGNGSGDDIVLRVWEGGSFADPGTLIYESAAVTDFTLNEWNVYELATPVALVGDNEYWIGYKIDVTHGYPVVIDAGPVVSGKGAWLFMNGEWKELIELNEVLDGNLRLRAGIGFPAEMPTTIADTELPTRVALHQNYPNPFNPSTTIRYTIPDARHVLLKVYNLLGQEVATLVNAEQQANTYEVVLDGSNLSSGVYVYRLYVGGVRGIGADAVTSKRLLLLR